MSCGTKANEPQYCISIQLLFLCFSPSVFGIFPNANIVAVNVSLGCYDNIKWPYEIVQVCDV